MAKKDGKNKKIVTAWFGNKFEVDTSDEACSKLGNLKYNDRVITHEKRKGTVMGVARTEEWENSGTQVLWIAFDDNDGKVTYVTNSSELKKAS